MLAAPAMAWAWEGLGRRTALLAAVAWSVRMQLLGVVAYDVNGWNRRSEGGRVLDVDRPEFPGPALVARQLAGGVLRHDLAESRRRKHDAHVRWIESWRPRPR